MGRAQGRAHADANVAARFDDALGGRRGLHGPVAVGREAQECPTAQLIHQVHDPAPARRRAGARELAERLRRDAHAAEEDGNGEGGERKRRTRSADGAAGEAPPSTGLQRSVLWVRCVSEPDETVRRELLDGLCCHLAACGEEGDVQHALTFLVALQDSPDPSTQKVLGALIARLGGADAYAHHPNGALSQRRRQQAAKLVSKELRADILDAYRASPGSVQLAEVLCRLAHGDNDLRKELTLLLRSDPELSRTAALARAYAQGMRGDYNDELLLTELAPHHPRVSASEPFAPLLGAWAEGVRKDTMNLDNAAWEAMGALWEGSGDGYDGIRQAMRKQLTDASKYFPYGARRAFEQCQDGELTPLAREVLDAAKAHPERAGIRAAIGERIAALPDAVRAQPGVGALAKATGEDLAGAVSERTWLMCRTLLSSTLSDGEARRMLAGSDTEQRIAALARRSGERYGAALLAGESPAKAVVRDIFTPEVAAFLGEFAAKDHRLEQRLKDTNAYRALQRKHGQRRVRKAFGDKEMLAAGYRRVFSSRGTGLSGPEDVLACDYHEAMRGLEQELFARYGSKADKD